MNSTAASTTVAPTNSTTTTVSPTVGTEITANITTTPTSTDSTSNPSNLVNNNTNTDSTTIITTDTLVNSSIELSPITATTTPTQAPASIVNSSNSNGSSNSNTKSNNNSTSTNTFTNSSIIVDRISTPNNHTDDTTTTSTTSSAGSAVTTAASTVWSDVGTQVIVDSYQTSTLRFDPQLMTLSQTSSANEKASTEIQNGELDSTFLMPNQEAIGLAASDTSTNLVTTQSQQILPPVLSLTPNSQQPMQIADSISLIENSAIEVNNQNSSSMVQQDAVAVLSEENRRLEYGIAANNYLVAQLSQANNQQLPAQFTQEIEIANTQVLQGSTAQVQPGIVQAATQAPVQPGTAQAVAQSQVSAEMVQAVAQAGIVVPAEIMQAQGAAVLVARMDADLKAAQSIQAQVEANLAQGNNEVTTELMNEVVTNVKRAEENKEFANQIQVAAAALNAVTTMNSTPETILAAVNVITANQPQLSEIMTANPIVQAAVAATSPLAIINAQSRELERIMTDQNLINATTGSSVPVMDNGASVQPLAMLEAQPNLVQQILATTPIVQNTTTSQMSIVNVDEGTRRNSISSNSTQSSSALSLSPMTTSTTPNLPPINGINMAMPTLIGPPMVLNNNMLGGPNHLKLFSEPVPPPQLDVKSAQQQLEQAQQAQQAQQEQQVQIQQAQAQSLKLTWR
ncbi:12888_t:CDS:2 [Ambispora gerdemannii]|uniref:12888_t:CDS:1 n=1 Tax=Ambispora gerdemannii TaxID=144530 RepID=A0A9N8YN26_9GLOM|nr:12888_t:CDS:2 [Ambispora gerdemannii]